MATINRGSFQTTHQDGLKKIMLEGPKVAIPKSPSEKWDRGRYDNAFKYLGDVSPSTVEIWLDRPSPDGPVATRIPGSGDFTVPKGTAVVDCRAIPLDHHEQGYRIKDSYPCGAIKDQNNAEIFKTLWDFMKTFRLLEHPPARIVFYDNLGQFRGPEIALRYIDAILHSRDHKSFINKQDIYFLNGGMVQYVKDIPQSRFLEKELRVKPKPKHPGTGS
ncbi:hypothetical protein G7054_g8794 [Neopestalotiopsis clavispora]|nr:hypothetical protein G7054_g8794 [Neopestalotiopsis clavispora]